MHGITCIIDAPRPQATSPGCMRWAAPSTAVQCRMGGPFCMESHGSHGSHGSSLMPPPPPHWQATSSGCMRWTASSACGASSTRGTRRGRQVGGPASQPAGLPAQRRSSCANPKPYRVGACGIGQWAAACSDRHGARVASRRGLGCRRACTRRHACRQPAQRGARGPCCCQGTHRGHHQPVAALHSI